VATVDGHAAHTLRPWYEGPGEVLTIWPDYGPQLAREPDDEMSRIRVNKHPASVLMIVRPCSRHPKIAKMCELLGGIEVESKTVRTVNLAGGSPALAEEDDTCRAPR
jgi:hypothetical protein